MFFSYFEHISCWISHYNASLHNIKTDIKRTHINNKLLNQLINPSINKTINKIITKPMLIGLKFNYLNTNYLTNNLSQKMFWRFSNFGVVFLYK